MIIEHETYDNLITFAIAYEELTINAADILAILGYEDNQAPEQVALDLENILKTAGDYCDIKGGIRLCQNLAIDQLNKSVSVQDVEFAAGKIITTHLKGADDAVLFVCTLGAGLENWSRDLMAHGDFLKGYMIDAVASVAVEAAVEKIHTHVAELFPGQKTSNRYSPGYCGWDVSEQHKLFSLLPENFCGITLSESSLMAPIKSVSGIIGLGHTMRKVDYTCRFCDMKECNYRRRQKVSLQD